MGEALKFETNPEVEEARLPSVGMLHKLGDLDGDGADELAISVYEAIPDAQEGLSVGAFPTYYVIEGRTEGWPSGTFDPSRAVAQTGDGPRSLVPGHAQRLQVSGAGDFDGDGFADLVVSSQQRTWVFYGSEAGMSGTLDPKRADAELAGRLPENPRWQGALVHAYVVGDLDGDGADDLAFTRASQLGILYGSKERWSGNVDTMAELLIYRADAPVYENDATLYVHAADVDGDTVPELVIQRDESGPDSSTGLFQPITKLYAIRTASQPLTGEYGLTAADVYQPAAAATEAGQTRAALDGDLDGDGSADLLLYVMPIGVPSPDEGLGTVYLMPGAPRAPD